VNIALISVTARHSDTTLRRWCCFYPYITTVVFNQWVHCWCYVCWWYRELGDSAVWRRNSATPRCHQTPEGSRSSGSPVHCNVLQPAHLLLLLQRLSLVSPYRSCLKDLFSPRHLCRRPIIQHMF